MISSFLNLNVFLDIAFKKEKLFDGSYKFLQRIEVVKINGLGLLDL